MICNRPHKEKNINIFMNFWDNALIPSPKWHHRFLQCCLLSNFWQETPHLLFDVMWHFCYQWAGCSLSIRDQRNPGLLHRILWLKAIAYDYLVFRLGASFTIFSCKFSPFSCYQNSYWKPWMSDSVCVCVCACECWEINTIYNQCWLFCIHLCPFFWIIINSF